MAWVREGTLGLIALTALAGIACGGARDDSSETDIPAVVAELRERFAVGDMEAVCSRLSHAGRVRAARSDLSAGCAAGLDASLDPRRRSRSQERSGDRRVTAVDVEGERAIATVTLSEKVPGELRFAREDGSWKLADIAVRPASSTWRWAEQPHYLTAWRARNGRRAPCPGVRHPRGGGCVYAMAGTTTLLMFTAVGDFALATCRSSYRLHLGAPEFLATRVRFEGRPPCNRIAHCADGETGLRYPWLGHGTFSRRTGAFRIDFDICVNTPMGRVRGFLLTDMRREKGAWAATSRDYPVGQGRLHIEGSWSVRPDDFRLGEHDRAPLPR